MSSLAGNIKILPKATEKNEGDSKTICGLRAAPAKSEFKIRAHRRLALWDSSRHSG